MKKPDISNLAFWGIEFDKLDFISNANFIICRISEYGTLSDLQNIWKFYGEEKVKESILSAYILKMKAIYVASLLLNIPKNEIPAFKNASQYCPVYKYSLELNLAT